MIVQAANWQTGLPNELFPVLFSHLKPHERTAACRTCKNWQTAHTKMVRDALVRTLDDTVEKIVAYIRELMFSHSFSVSPFAEIREVLIPLPASYAHTSRLCLSEVDVEAKKRVCWANLQRLKRILYNFDTQAAPLPREELEEMRSTFCQLVSTFPTFNELREAQTVPKIRTAFLQAQELLRNFGSFLSLDYQSFVSRYEIEEMLFSLAHTRQPYALNELVTQQLSKNERVLQRFPKEFQQATLGCSRTPNMLAHKLQKVCHFALTGSPVDIARELITCNEFSTRNIGDLIASYSLNHQEAIDVLVEELLKRERYEDVVKIVICRDWSKPSLWLVVDAISTLLKNGREDFAVFLFGGYINNLRSNRSTEAMTCTVAILKMAIREGRKVFALGIWDTIKTNYLLGRVVLEYPDSLTLLHWMQEANVRGEAYQYTAIAKELLSHNREQELLELVEEICLRVESRDEILRKLAEVAIKNGKIALSMRICYKGAVRADYLVDALHFITIVPLYLIIRRLFH